MMSEPGFSPAQKAALEAPLDAAHVKEREQAGRTFSYIEGWRVIEEANRIFGFDGWTRQTVELKCVAEGPRKIGKALSQREGFGASYIAKVQVVVRAGARRSPAKASAPAMASMSTAASRMSPQSRRPKPTP
jgi:recombination DNA repair RAD52 pathway protein